MTQVQLSFPDNMNLTIKHFLIATILIILLALTVGVALPRYISKQHDFIGIVAGHIYVDNSSNKVITLEDSRTCYSILGRGGAGLAAITSLITQRMTITATRDLEVVPSCGACSAKLYTFFNIKYMHADRSIKCEA